MNCPFCGHFDSKVIDSRDVNDGIRRRLPLRPHPQGKLAPPAARVLPGAGDAPVVPQRARQIDERRDNRGPTLLIGEDGLLQLRVL